MASITPNGLWATLGTLEAILRSLNLAYHTAHINVRGGHYYGDHLLLQRLYFGEAGGQAPITEIDGVMERRKGLYPQQLLDARDIAVAMGEWVPRLMTPGVPVDWGKLIQGEQEVLKTIDTAIAQARHDLPLSQQEGVVNLLAGIADAHQQTIYLLQERAMGEQQAPVARTAGQMGLRPRRGPRWGRGPRRGMGRGMGSGMGWGPRNNPSCPFRSTTGTAVDTQPVITIKRLEGTWRHGTQGDTVRGLAAAVRVLHDMHRKDPFPSAGGDKVMVKVDWPDGFSKAIRLDLTAKGPFDPFFYLRREARFYLGELRPAAWSDAEYQAFLESTAIDRDYYQELLQHAQG